MIAASERPICAVENGKVVGVVDKDAVLRRSPAKARRLWPIAGPPPRHPAPAPGTVVARQAGRVAG